MIYDAKEKLQMNSYYMSSGLIQQRFVGKRTLGAGRNG